MWFPGDAWCLTLKDFCLLKKEEEEVVYIYNEMLLDHKKKEMLSFAAIWMDLEGIMLSEICQRQTNTV